QFNQVKTWAINELGMGTNSKVHVQFRARFWRGQGCTGETYADTGYQNTWEVSRAQPGTSGILVWYTGGNSGVVVGSGTVSSQVTRPVVRPGLRERETLSTVVWSRHVWSPNHGNESVSDSFSCRTPECEAVRTQSRARPHRNPRARPRSGRRPSPARAASACR